MTIHVIRTLVSLLLVPGVVSAAARDGSGHSWYRVSIADAVVGAATESWRTKASEHFYEWHFEYHLTSGGERTTFVLHGTEWNDTSGRVLRFNTRLNSNGSLLETNGESVGDSIVAVTKGNGYSSRRAALWEPGAVGEGALDRVLRRAFDGGQSEHEIRIFDAHWMNFRSAVYRRGQLSDGLIEIHEFEPGSAQPLVTTWVDEDYQVVRTLMRQLGVEIQIDRVTEAEFRALEFDPNFDLVRQSMIPCERSDGGSQPAPRGETRFVLEFDSDIGEGVVVDGPNQRVTRVDDHTLRVAVTREPAFTTTASDAELEPYLKPSVYIQSDHEAIVAMADMIAADRDDAWRVVLATARYVDSHIAEKTYGRGFDTAVDVCASRAGDCTEHAVLLTALLRAQGIPARTAIGVAWDGRFLIGHMWTEAYVDYWRTIDALDVDNHPNRIRIGVAADERALNNLDMVKAYSVLGGVKASVEN